jgi:hypothetical protein
MNPRRVRPAEWGTGACGLLLLLSLFLPWFGVDAWHTYDVTDLILALVAAVAIALPVICLTNGKTDGPISASAATVLAGAVASVLVIWSVIDPASGGGSGAGLYLALAASLGVMVFAWRAMIAGGNAVGPDRPGRRMSRE